MWNRLRFIRFLQVSQIFQRRKSDANKQDFENKFNLRCHAQSTPKTTGILTKVFSTSGPNLVALAWTGDELSRRQAQNGVNFDFEVKFDLEGQGQSPPKTIGILTKVFYIYGPNLVILAETGHELSRGQARDWHTDGHTHTQTDAGNDNTRRPILASGKNEFPVSRIVYAISDRIWCNKHNNHTTTEKYDNNGKKDTSDLMMIITWAIDISFQSPLLKWAGWTHTTPYIAIKIKGNW